MRAPIVERNVLTTAEIAELRAFGDDLFIGGGYNKVAVNAHRATSIQLGILLTGTYGSNTLQVSFEVTTGSLSPLSKIQERAADLIRRFSDRGGYTNIGYNYFLGQDPDLLTQVPHVDNGYSEVYTLAGQGGVRVFPDGRTPYDIQCQAGDWVMPLENRHAGFGIPSESDPRVSVYFYTPFTMPEQAFEAFNRRIDR
jgi:hypothetical protein